MFPFSVCLNVYCCTLRTTASRTPHHASVSEFLLSNQGTLLAFAKMSSERGGHYGDGLPDAEKLTQLKAVKGCLAAGIPLNALGNPVFKEFLAHLKVDLPGAQHLSKHVTFILEEEVRATE